MIVVPHGATKWGSIRDKQGKIKGSEIKRIDWKEKRGKQRYDYKYKKKVGSPEKIYIKKLVEKRKADKIPIKIGKNQITLKSKQKSCHIKIGHEY